MSSLFASSAAATDESATQQLEIVHMFPRLIAMLLSSIVMLDTHAAKNVPPSVTMTANLTFPNAPGTIALSATASDSDGSIANVQFFNGTTLIATLTQVPYAHTWSNIAAGTYSLSARATDNKGAVTTTQSSVVTVLPGEPQVHFVYADQINYPREITNASGNLVWRADTTEPFGANVPNENPAGLGTFTYNVRFPGQYYDKETGMHYNYKRDYDPAMGRYMQSDPIGLEGGVNTYSYVDGNPTSKIDPTGEFGIPGAIGAAGFNFGTQFLTNLYLSNGDWKRALKCVDFGDVLISGALGFVGPSFLSNVLGGKVGPAGLTAAQNRYIYFTKSMPVGVSIKNGIPPLRIGDECECRGMSLGNMLGTFAH